MSMQLFAMGGYGPYVWTAYGLTLFVFSVNLVMSWQEKRRVKKIIKQYLNHES